MDKTVAYRTERDSLGTVNVPADRYWGAQTQRCLENFPIGTETMPAAFIGALGIQKKAAARVNARLGILDAELANAVEQAADEVIDGTLIAHFPLKIWQSGSGTQTNMNANEVIANRANELLGAGLGKKSPVHPNDHVNMSQSSNDSIPTAMHIAAVLEIERHLLPALETLRKAFEEKSGQFEDAVKIGRTHLQDAVPLTVGQVFSGYARQIESAVERVRHAEKGLLALAQGGTAVGTGLNAPAGFATAFVYEVAALTGIPFETAANKFEALATNDALVGASGVLNGLAAALMKIANDIRLLSSGPRCGLGELILPANEPGSSIMPGKVNPTQAEALAMIAARVMGHHTTVTVAGASGTLELNTFRPVAIACFLEAARLLADGCGSFAARCVDGTDVDRAVLRRHLEHSLMLVTALSPHIGYDKAAEIAHKAHREGSSLKDAAMGLGYVSENDFERWVDPAVMAGRAGPDTETDKP
ncbi:MAG: class II fumarate hydratase [Rhodospirillales bacterium]